MRKKPTRKKSAPDELRREYEFDYSKGRPNRFAKDFASGTVVAVVLDSDVAKVFTTSEDVNTMLRSVMSALPKASKPPSTRVRGTKPASAVRTAKTSKRPARA